MHRCIETRYCRIIFKYHANARFESHCNEFDVVLYLFCPITIYSFVINNSVLHRAFHCILVLFIFAFRISFTVTAQGSQTLTQNGSSFESASSIYSLARVENICEDAPTTTVDDTLPLPPPPSGKPSPSHSISSSSSGSFFNGKKAMKSTSPRGSVVVQQQAVAATSKTNTESISDDEKSEKRYSSSGYYESPHDDGKLKNQCEKDFSKY